MKWTSKNKKWRIEVTRAVWSDRGKPEAEGYIIGRDRRMDVWFTAVSPRSGSLYVADDLKLSVGLYDEGIPKYVLDKAIHLANEAIVAEGRRAGAFSGFSGELVGVGADIMERLVPAKQVRKIRKLSDDQTGELAVRVWWELARRIDEALGREGQGALSRLMLQSNFQKDTTGLTRNNIFKAANVLGIELPSHFF